MQKYLLFILLSFFCGILSAQYADRLLEYKPAPGQHINTAAGNMDAALSITENINGLVSLGGFGGYIVLGFSEAVVNDPDNPYGIDFTVFGNAGPDWSEPAAVYVMKDENENDLPDDQWFLLAGPGYFFDDTDHNYRITFYNPQKDVASDVKWDDNRGNTGWIRANSFKSQPYYPDSDIFPSVSTDNYDCSGILVQPDLDFSDPYIIRSYPQPFGFADNHPRSSLNSELPDNPYTEEQEGHGGDPMDISWADDSEGNYIVLDEIHFVKLQTAVNANAGYLGELSSEISGVMDIAPNKQISGMMEMIIIEGCPKEIETGNYQLKGLVYEGGKMISEDDLYWEVFGSNVSINNQGLLEVFGPGEFRVKAALNENPQVFDEVHALAVQTTDSPRIRFQNIEIQQDYYSGNLLIKGAGQSDIRLMDLQGRIISEKKNCNNEVIFLTAGIRPGIYLLQIFKDDRDKILKIFIK